MTIRASARRAVNYVGHNYAALVVGAGAGTGTLAVKSPGHLVASAFMGIDGAASGIIAGWIVAMIVLSKRKDVSAADILWDDEAAQRFKQYGKIGAATGYAIAAPATYIMLSL